jgi:peptide/nickel transport system substrate-binding protein
VATALRITQPSVGVIDPHVWTDARDLLNIRFAVYEPLVWPDWSGAYTGVVAQDWTTEDGRSWVFTIRPGIHFHDGRPLRAADVVTSLDRARDPSRVGQLATGALYQTYLGAASLTTLGDDRVRIVTRAPMADLLDVVAEIPIVAGASDTARAPVGTGSYRIADQCPGEVMMESVRAHWAGAPAFDRLAWRADPAEGSRVESLLEGNTDVATGFSGAALSALRAPRCEAFVMPTSACVILICNVASGACVDRRVRQALNHALDIPAIIATVKHGAATPINGALTPLHLGYDPDTPAFERDRDAALRLLERAGYQGGLELTLDVPTMIPDEAPLLASVIAEQYRSVGITTVVRTFADRSAYAEMVKAKQMDDLACFDSTPLSTYRIMREKLHAGVAGPWWQGYRNPEVDRLVDLASATPDLASRRTLYRRAYRLIRDDAPWVFLYSPSAIVGVGPGGRSITAEPQGTLRFPIM